MPPRKNVAPSNAIHQFRCDLCSKGYPRQQDYESHLRSYDHNHRQRLAEMKKLTNRNDESSQKKRGPEDLKSVPVDAANRKSGAGPKFTKIGGGADTGLRFKKVGVAVSGAGKEKDSGKGGGEEEDKLEKMMREQEELRKKIEAMKKEKETQEKNTDSPKQETMQTTDKESDMAQKADEDVVMGGQDEAEEEETWEEYDFTKPTGCDHASCAGCKTDGIWDDDFEIVPIAV